MVEQISREAHMIAPKLLVCVNQRFASDCCKDRGGEAIVLALRAEIARRGLSIMVERIYCFGLCTMGPNVRIAPAGAFFHQVSLLQIAQIVDEVEKVIRSDK